MGVKQYKILDTNISELSTGGYLFFPSDEDQLSYKPYSFSGEGMRKVDLFKSQLVGTQLVSELQQAQSKLTGAAP